MHEQLMIATLAPVKSVGENLKGLRERAGYATAADFARAVGMTSSRIADLETNRYVLPDTKTLLTLAKALKCSVDDLLAGTDVAYDAVIAKKVALYEKRVAGLRELFERTVQARSAAGNPITGDEFRKLREEVNDLIANAGRAIFREDAEPEVLSDDERDVLEMYREITPRAKSTVLALLGQLQHGEQRPKPKPSRRKAAS